jgi:hypothetical protein
MLPERTVFSWMFLLLACGVVAAIGWLFFTDPFWRIDRIRETSHLRSLPVTAGENGHKTLAEAVRQDVPKGTSLAKVRNYTREHFVNDGHLIIEDTTLYTKRAHAWPPRLRLRINEGGCRLAGSDHTDILFVFDDDGRLNDADASFFTSYL